MINRGGGSIINIASVASSLRGYNRRCVYGATKAAVIGLTKGLAMEHVRDGIRCNVMCPSQVAGHGIHTRSAHEQDQHAINVCAIEKKS
ncbi:3-hydroxybutyrate dehydrogenase type 2 [Portunus trituberculatus]|uniref:Dehydrogenase/reductase SDR family member 6 n=1 Tax=Portunus trituberculatus TaxID=210409 RepID=A0A5B7ICP1_PORTR|nr:3-hydroxybutyrate dehydrogenase type 2 [Portunus trituberculatus]